MRLTRSGFNFLNAEHLNEIIGALNSGTAGGFTIPCIDTGTLLDSCVGPAGFHFRGYPALFRVWIDDEAAGLPQKDTALDLDLRRCWRE